jgi:enterochelin esterase-like enzyme
MGSDSFNTPAIMKNYPTRSGLGLRSCGRALRACRNYIRPALLGALAVSLLGTIATSSKAITYSAPWVNQPSSSLVVPPSGYGTYNQYTYYSNMLAKDVGYSIYLPPSYATQTTRKYPVIFLLHGVYGNETQWMGQLSYFWSAMVGGTLKESVIVLVNGFYDGYYSDTSIASSQGGGARAESELIGNLIPTIETNYRVLHSRGGRALVGFSMGGYGACRLALRHPMMFGTVVSLGGDLFNRNDAAQYWQGGLPSDTTGHAQHSTQTLLDLYYETANSAKYLLYTGTGDTVTGYCYPAAHDWFTFRGVTHTYENISGVTHDYTSYMSARTTQIMSHLNTNLTSYSTSNIPKAVITAPVVGAYALDTDNVTVSVTATAGSGRSIARVEFYLDNKWIANDTTSPYSFTINKLNKNFIGHSIQVWAVDSAGDVGAAACNLRVNAAIPSGNYKIGPKGSTLIWGIASGTTTDNTSVLTFADGTETWKQWQFVSDGGGFYKIKNVSTGKYWTTSGNTVGSYSDGIVQKAAVTGAAYQRFIVENLGEGNIFIRQTVGGYVLSMYGSNTATGSSMVSYSYDSNYPDSGKHKITNMTSSSPQLQIANGTYKLTNKSNGRVLEVGSSSTANGASIDTWDYWGGANQKWTFSDLGESQKGAYKVINMNSSKALCIGWINDGPWENYIYSIQYDYSLSSNMHWNIVPNGDGYYKILNAYSGQALTLNTSNLLTWQYQWENSDAQKWTISTP